MNLSIVIEYTPPFTRVRALSPEFFQEEAEFIWASKWASLGREGTVEPITCEVEYILQSGVVSIKKSKTCLITYPFLLVV